ncbi:glycosyltransferase family 2 protein [Flavobacterium aquiphilum]|uniref:glycosyltransferase family 2 protein n=1 Tax=Flavobacterium aquiphilum TaxID=3003261 RepID=UPI0024816CA3|nr:glycosyltransferase family A protein [Flavobacterium aquiphilum]
MIIIYHKNNRVLEIDCKDENIGFSQTSIIETLFEIALAYPEKLIIWCCIDFKSNLNYLKIQNIFHHHKIMASYNLSENLIISGAIGYVEESPFIKVNKKVNYPTWIMSSDIGGVYASVLIALKDEVKRINEFDYFLNSMAKLAMPNGLLCYSEPQLVIGIPNKVPKYKNNLFVLFRFVKQHYKTRWVFGLLLNLFLYERKLAVLPFLFSFFYRKRKIDKNLLEKIEVQSTKKVLNTGTVDVIIPTIGRKQYLYDVLKDLAQQTHLPKNVIIVEQNPDSNSASELDYINSENWPFMIKHTFTHQTGACNARNVALSQVDSEWVFMADDDIRIENFFLELAFNVIKKEGSEQVTFGCYEADYSQKNKLKQRVQWGSFGSGCSMVKSKNIKSILYNLAFEFGYGEDSDFGMQLRNKGNDILFFPEPEILHLKAPIGGFRTKPILEWGDDIIQPKPSPTVMLYKQLHLGKEQINGYKTILFLKFYKIQAIKNPFVYFYNYRKRWEQSLYWANKLKGKK